jgi:GNAT superfamily N-acetyltransferase
MLEGRRSCPGHFAAVKRVPYPRSGPAWTAKLIPCRGGRPFKYQRSSSHLTMAYTIRQATVDDAEAFEPLLASLGYPNQPAPLRSRITTIIRNPDAELLVAVNQESDQVVGLLSLHFIPQLGIQDDVARIGFFVVDESCQRAGIGRLLETHAERLCVDRGCNRMVVLR